MLRDSYFEERIYVDAIEREGLPMTFWSRHRPLASIARSVLDAGLLIDHVGEVPDSAAMAGSRWRRIPLFLHLGGVKADGR